MLIVLRYPRFLSFFINRILLSLKFFKISKLESVDESSQIIKMNYKESQNIIIYRMNTPIQIIFDKNQFLIFSDSNFLRRLDSITITTKIKTNNQGKNMISPAIL